MRFARSGMGAAAYINGIFLVMGGETGNGPDVNTVNGQVYPQVDAYDPVAQTWTQVRARARVCVCVRACAHARARVCE